MIPRNCTECPHTKTCQRYYGARGCKYEKEIIKEINNDKEEVATL